MFRLLVIKKQIKSKVFIIYNKFLIVYNLRKYEFLLKFILKIKLKSYLYKYKNLRFKNCVSIFF